MPQSVVNSSISNRWLIFNGSIVHSVDEQQLLALENKIIGVQNGKIEFLEDASKLEESQKKFGYGTSDVYNLNEGEFLIPGLIDTHIHAPQYANAGLGLGEPLMEWLQNYTYPCEAKYENLDFAKEVYEKVVRRTLGNGTTTAAYFATIHVEASLLLCDIIEQMGQRAYVGKVNVDCNTPDWYCENAETSVNLTKVFIENVLDRKNPLLTPVVTPRFAPCCSASLMSALGELAQKYDIPIQSHISESVDEIHNVCSQFPDSTNYAQVYNKSGLLTNNTIMAHGVHLTDEELDILKDRGVGIAHCPNSNISLKSGLCDVKRLMKHGLKVGLGTDVSGGYSPSILDAMRQAIQTSSILSMSKSKDYQPITYREAFFLATLGGSQVLGLDHKIGNFEVGKEFDALLIDTKAEDGPIDTFDGDTLDEKLQRFVYIGDDRNIKKVYIKGREVKSEQSLKNSI